MNTTLFDLIFMFPKPNVVYYLQYVSGIFEIREYIWVEVKVKTIHRDILRNIIS